MASGLGRQAGTGAGGGGGWRAVRGQRLAAESRQTQQTFPAVWRLLAVCEALEVRNHSFRIPWKPVIDSAECLQVFITVMWESADRTHFRVGQPVVNRNIVRHSRPFGRNQRFLILRELTA